MKTGFAGQMAKLFINSKLTPLLMVAFMVIGVYSAYLTPREEEPQIDVPIADIFLRYPGASPAEIESRVMQPLEKVVANIPGVEYVYSTSMPGQAMLIVQFYVGEDIERSLVKMYNEIMKHMDEMPKGTSMPLIKTRAIDDVPVLGLTFWSENYDDFQLKRIAQEVNNEIEKVNDVSETKIIGGRSRQVRVILNRAQMAGYNIDALSIARQIEISNQQIGSGAFNNHDTEYLVETGRFLENSEDVANLVVGVYNGSPIYLKQVAEVVDGPEVPSQYVSFGYGKINEAKELVKGNYPAVTISVAKRRGADAMKVAEQILTKTAVLEQELIPADVHVEVSRNYGETASDKVSELLMHLLGAIIAVTFVVMLAMGWRGGLVVFLSVPITFALTMFSYYFLDYTLNRITLFALVFVTGIVVDDSIIIAENMHRHFKMKQLPFMQAALRSIDEVGNPTILATFTVIAAVLPMVFVSGLMGPYMSPMPIGASIAMIFSLLVALTITPYLAYRLLRFKEKDDADEKAFKLEDSMVYKLYSATISPMLESKWKRWSFIGTVVVLLLASTTLVYFKQVAVKMLPFDNKNEFQVVIDMPEGTTLERTAVVAKELAAYISQQENVVDYQTYVGTAAPMNFNGLVRHYDLRRGSNVADIQVNLTHKDERDEQSHDIAKLMRPALQEIGKKFNANVKVVEVPPGPPVMSTLVAEIYGPNLEEQRNIAAQVKTLFEKTDDVVDVDWLVEDDQTEFQFNVNKEKAMLAGVSTQQVVHTLNMALQGQEVSQLYQESEHNQVGIDLRLQEKDRSSVADLKRINILSQSGQLVSLGDIVDVHERIKEKSIYRKNQKRVVYVTADVAGKLESPVYGIMNIAKNLSDIKLPEGYDLKEEYTQQPFLEDNYSLKWDGEWQITYEVFRDLGTAFAVVLLVIYLLIIGWFQNFKVPFVMMISIPLSLVGILVGHWLMGAFFTATSMIGLIALAGIMVRNAILLIDFINLRLEDGIPLKEAVIEAGAVRTTPILLTAGTVVIGAVVILFDPIFQGLAISLMGGSIASTFLTLVIVPLIYYMTEKKKYPVIDPKSSEIKDEE
ncbi:AcrB/AcrD/AcrF family protein [Labilibaculum sp. A4]|uniref:AcrB/AcrD/AcrF family protein n=1 Tax=Labilibaculum euxinus TaxID=2686357 RepID=A0A425YFI2_9BACT|nr:efflux RND transporter permease subunit [Labilibaculum euxinus]MDQ1770389.1 efflux RND transporter permease subunit [Labilibaculum euxinus]MUP38335.1 AcrB/AcrD/AcrF family protein [Labilibaculum euxinus]MVB07540.1 AcrB/AcrD/AcrF family protein [Labilibaculum euxinus]MWN75391.1 AcrB/AcrD/AcrF family protein [Labilibaculum euxinus]